MKKNIINIKKINLKVILNKGVNIHVLEKIIPFDIKRIYFLTKFNKNKIRDGHCHKLLEQFYICIRGRIKIYIEGKNFKKIIILKGSDTGIYLKKLTWRSLKSLANNSILLVLASDVYKKTDYIRNYNEFKNKIS
jgi:hypothetical protein